MGCPRVVPRRDHHDGRGVQEGGEAHVPEVFRFLERRDQIRGGARHAVEGETAATEVQRRQVRIARNHVGELLQEHGDLPNARDSLVAFLSEERDPLFRSLALTSPGFAIEPEITARLVQHGERIFEVPVHYRARSTEEGKKLTAMDGFRVLATLLRCRLSP